MAEEKAEYDIWLPENHKGSRKVILNVHGRSFAFNLNQKNVNADDFNKHRVKLTESELEGLRTSYGFKSRKAAKSSAPAEVEGGKKSKNSAEKADS